MKVAYSGHEPARDRTPATFAEYIAMEQMATGKHQLVHGEVFDISGGTPEHAALVLNTGAELRNQLREGVLDAG